ncbi:MAG: SPOR domain-containing protein [Spirochaetia bacterium]
MVQFRTLLFGVLLVTLTLLPLLANDIDTARNLAEEGDIEEALEEYRSWLIENPLEEAMPAMLFEALSLIDSVEEQLSFLENFIEAESSNLSIISLSFTAQIAELAGDILYARDAYHRLWLLTEDPAVKQHNGLHLSFLYLETGRVEAAREVLLEIHDSPANDTLEKQAQLQLARIHLAEDELEEAETILESLLSEEHEYREAALFLLYSFTGNAAYLQELSEDYSSSVETFITNNRSLDAGSASRIPSPFDMLGRLSEDSLNSSSLISTDTEESQSTEEQRTDNRASETAESSPIEEESQSTSSALEDQTSEGITLFIQTGSFRMLENAEYMIQDLENAEIESTLYSAVNDEGVRLYKVLVPVPENTRIAAQRKLQEIREAGFNGFIIQMN